MIGSGNCTSKGTQLLAPNRLRRQVRERGNSKRGGHPDDRCHGVSSPLSGRLLLLLVMAAGTCVLTGCAKKVVVPDVSQQDLDQAQKTLAAGNLKPGNISGSSGTGAYVVSQSPAAGQQVSANSAVDLVVALPVTVPNLTGGNLTDAVSTLQGLGLKVAFVQKPTMNIFAKAKVEQQEPPATSLVHGDAIVTLTVSTSPNIAALLGLATKEPAYQNLNPAYKDVLDAFLGDPSTPRGMGSSPKGPSPPTPGTPRPSPPLPRTKTR